METNKKTCVCRSCTYGLKVRDLIARTENHDDKKFIEEIFSNQFHAEDDRDYYKILATGYRAKYGPMSFHEACTITNEAETKAKSG